MKRLLSILNLTIFITTGATNLISCYKPVNKIEPNLKEENQKLKWKIDKNILFINSINSPFIINANKPNAVKEYELVLSLKPKVLESIKTIDDSLTEDDFIIAFKDYFNHLQPQKIDLTISKKITIIIAGKNKTHGKKEFNVVLQAIPKD